MPINTLTLTDLTAYYQPKTAAKKSLMRAIVTAQSKGWAISQNTGTGQVQIRIQQEVDPPQWAIDRDPYYKGRTLTRTVELCITGSGRNRLSIIRRVYHGSCFAQAGFTSVSMKATVDTLTAADPWTNRGRKS